MTTEQVAGRFNELAQEGKFNEILIELFATHAKSIEPIDSPFETVEGMDNILEKGKKFHESIIEMHGGYTSAPLVAGNYFTCTMGMDVTMKTIGRQKFDEVAVYQVQEGKIISEQFFF